MGWPAKLFWVLVAGIGVASFAVIAIVRDEPVNALWLVTASICVCAIAYRFYGAWLAAKVLTVNTRRSTPACVHPDGRDYVPTHPWIVFGHHFAAIAGPGPLVGPVLAAQFGYLPGTLWILIGATLGGAVQDAVILFASIRRDGKSLGQMMREEISPLAGAITLVSILSIIVILIAVLGLVVVKALAESPWGAFTIACTIPIALAMGLALRYGWPGRTGLVSVFGLAALLASVYFGQYIPDTAWGRDWFGLSGPTLALLLIFYGLAASALPVWLLLAPRDYLSTFMKIGTVGVLAIAIIFLAPDLKMPALTRFIDGTGPVFAGPVFPFCFITIACGAVSGFHSLIASGTTPKLVTSESAVLHIGYGAMVTEMLVSIMALVAACALEPGVYFAINMKGAPEAVTQTVSASGFPVTVAQMNTLADQLGESTLFGRTGGAPTFAVGMAVMFARVFTGPEAMALWYHFAIMFEALFILTTIDAGTRVGRFIMQDALGHLTPRLGPRGGWLSDAVASALFVAAWGWFLYQGVIDPLGGINSLWPIFGIANQLLAVIALAFGTTLLIKMGKTRYIAVTLAPLVWLTAVTLSAGYLKIFSPDPKLGFLRAARDLQIKISDGAAGTQMDQWRHLLLNNYINAAVTAVYLALVMFILVLCAWEWWRLLSGKKRAVLSEC
jgi:carbon starvation protein